MVSTVRMDVKEVLRHFKELEDPRSSVNLLHPLAVWSSLRSWQCSPEPTGQRPLPSGPISRRRSCRSCWNSRTAYPRKMSSGAFWPP